MPNEKTPLNSWERRDMLKKIAMMAAAAALVSGAAAADDYETWLMEYEHSINALKQHMLANRIGSSPDYMLQVHTGDGWQDYLLIFGNAEDGVACQQIAEVLPWFEEARCIRAN